MAMNDTSEIEKGKNKKKKKKKTDLYS